MTSTQTTCQNNDAVSFRYATNCRENHCKHYDFLQRQNVKHFCCWPARVKRSPHVSSKMAAATTSLNLVWDDLDCETSNYETKCNWPSTIAKCHTSKKNLLFQFLLPNISFGINTCLSFCKRFYWHQKRAFLPLLQWKLFKQIRVISDDGCMLWIIGYVSPTFSLCCFCFAFCC